MPAKSEQNKPAVAAASTSAAPPMPSKSGASERATKDEQLAAILAKATAAISPDDPLATSEEKGKGLRQIVETVYAELPPRLWTPRQYDDFVEFFVAAAAKAGSFSLPPIPPAWDGAYLGSVFTIQQVKNMAEEFQGRGWLLSSPTPEEFISRAIHLQAKELWPPLNNSTNADQLKKWLKSAGCTDVESCRAFLRKSKEAGVRLTALDQLRTEFGE
jgi:hypothetical protein